jgi:hypothetical protein
MREKIKKKRKETNSYLQEDMTSSVFWDITPCSPLKVDRRLGETYLIHLQGYVPPKRRMTFRGLQGVISQKIVLFITTAVSTSNP